MKTTIKLLIASAVITIGLVSCNSQDAKKEKEILDLKAQLAQIAQTNATIAENLKTFDYMIMNGLFTEKFGLTLYGILLRHRI